MKKKSTSYIEAMGVKYPATCKGLTDAIASVPASGGMVRLGKGVSIQLPEKAIVSLCRYIQKVEHGEMYCRNFMPCPEHGAPSES